MPTIYVVVTEASGVVQPLATFKTKPAAERQAQWFIDHNLPAYVLTQTRPDDDARFTERR